MAARSEETSLLPTWNGDWSQFRAYEMKVSLEVDSVKKEDRCLVGQALQKHLLAKLGSSLKECTEASCTVRMAQPISSNT